MRCVCVHSLIPLVCSLHAPHSIACSSVRPRSTELTEYVFRVVHAVNAQNQLAISVLLDLLLGIRCFELRRPRCVDRGNPERQ